MALAIFDIRKSVGKNRAQSSRRVEIKKTIDFSTINGGVGLAATEDAAFMTTPKNFIYEDCHPVLKLAEGEASSVDIGTEADVGGLLDGGDMNGVANAAIVKAGTESIAPGTVMSETELRVLNPALGATLNVGKIDIVLVGYISDVL